MKTYCVPLLATLVSGCATFQTPKEVLVPVSVSCISQMPNKPNFLSKEQLKATPNNEYPIIVTIELFKHENYSSELEAVLSGCK